MGNYNTLHIFGYGECQLIEDTENKTVPTDDCPSAQDVVVMIYALKPVDNNAGTDYRTINIFNNMFADYQSVEGNFRVDYSELDSELIDQLATEIENG
jgi:hypothetical protein